MTAPLRTEALLHRIAHDLRGPLMPLRTAAWLLRNESDESERTRELAQIIDRQSVRLAQLMDELSDWALSAGSSPMPGARPLDPILALDIAIGAIPGCTSTPHVAPELHATRLMADERQFELMMRSLIEHAMHRDGGRSPEIESWLGDGCLQIRVRDGGDPLDPEARASLFDEPQARPFDDGLGLRLLMARGVAEAHGGSIRIDQGDTAGLSLLCTLPVDGR